MQIPDRPPGPAAIWLAGALNRIPKGTKSVLLYKFSTQGRSGQTVVVPVILRACLWQHSEFAKLQAVPKDGKLVCSWPNRDEALMQVAGEIKKLADESLGNR